MLSALENALAAADSEAVQDAVFDLTLAHRVSERIDDDVAFEIIAILRRPEMWGSSNAGHVLNFFEFASPHLSQEAKDRCAAFLREWGGKFTDVHSVQVVAELRAGPYLKVEPPKPPRRKPRSKANDNREN